MRQNNPLKHIGLFILRVGFSAGMMTHGWPKLQKLMNMGEVQFPDPLGIGAIPSLILTVLGEFVFPILVILGFKTRIAALPVAITMAVAFFVVHHGDAFNRKELAFVYLIAFVVIACVGPGKFSIDGTTKKRR